MILLSHGHDSVLCAVGIMLRLHLMAVMVTKAAIMMTMPMPMTKVMAVMVVMMTTVVLMMMAMLVLGNFFALHAALATAS